MKENLILHPTPLAQWHALVEEARQSSSVVLSEELESYLVFLLMRFQKNPEVVNSILAVDFLKNVQKTGRENLQILRDVGDKCLLFSGFFPELAKQRRVQISYYVELGQSAYSSLSEFHNNELSQLFRKLCHHFVGLMDILYAIKALDPHTNASVLDLLTAEELWNKTKSEHALKVLRNATQGFLITQDSFNIYKKH